METHPRRRVYRSLPLDDPEVLLRKKNRGPPPPPTKEERDYHHQCLTHSLPQHRFDFLASKEVERNLNQLEPLRTDRMTPWPRRHDLDLRAKAENKVRDAWIEVGIWKEEWGPAWPEDIKDFRGAAGPRPYGRWHHENDPENDPEPKAQPTAEGSSKIPASTSDGPKRKTKKEKKKEEAKKYKPPLPSHPLSQFLAECSMEYKWLHEMLKEGITITAKSCDIGIDDANFVNVRNDWMLDKIWKSGWVGYPGTTWTHEEYLQEAESTHAEAFRSLIDGPTSQPGHDAASSSEWHVRHSACSPTHSPNAADSGGHLNTSSLASTAADTASEKVSSPDTVKGTPPCRLQSVGKSPDTPDGSADHTSQSENSSKMAEQSRPGSSRPTVRFTEEEDEVIEPAPSPNSVVESDSRPNSRSGGVKASSASGRTRRRKPTPKATQITSSPIRRSSRTKAKTRKV